MILLCDHARSGYDSCDVDWEVALHLDQASACVTSALARPRGEDALWIASQLPDLRLSATLIRLQDRFVVKEVAMPPAVKGRKIMAATTRNLGIPTSQKGIQAFGKISKSQVQPHEQSASGKKEASIDVCLASVSKIAKGKKRKLEFAEDYPPEQKHSGEATTFGESRTAKDGVNQIKDYQNYAARATELLPSTDATTPRKKTRSQQYESKTPTKGARSLLEALVFPSSSPTSTAPSPVTTLQETPPSSPVSTKSPQSDQNNVSILPAELQDLINLHSSFLTVLSFHYAHNGSMAPADLRNLAPGIERAWRKRKTTTDDIRRILALERDVNPNGKEKAGPLYLTDYGHGKICVEITVPHHSQQIQRRPLDEEALISTFVRNLEQQWTSYKATHPSSSFPATLFSSLDLAPITPCASLSKIAPLVSKGQRRLEDLKAGAIRAQQTPLTTTTANSIHPPHPCRKHTGARSTDLFSRLKAKQLHQSTLPLPPSAKLLARKSALQRLPEIAPVLGSLAISSKKHCDDDASAEVARSRVTHASFTMPTVVQHLQMSLRNPIGKEEAARCVRLMVEVVPEWVDVKAVGKMVGVTIRGSGIGRDDLGRRIGTLAERL